MSYTHTFNRGVNDGSQSPPPASATVVTNSGNPGYDGVIAANTTNHALLVAFGNTTLQSIHIVANANTKLMTNSASVPQEVINLVANQPLQWLASDGYFTIPFAGPVTEIFVNTGANVGGTQLSLRAITNAG